MKLLHKRRVARALYYASRWRLKKWLGLSENPNLNVVHGDFQQAVDRHKRVCNTLGPYFRSVPSLEGGIAVEIGSGDCLAAADMLLSMGAKRVHLIDQRPIVISPEHRAIVDALVADQELANSGKILMRGEPARLNSEMAMVHTGLLEAVGLPESADLIYSFDVLEHVEDLDGFFRRCREMSKPGTMHVHKFDLSGHEFFEDPLPPLDFQTYPDWLFNLMFPKYRRAVGHLADEIFDAMRENGFVLEKIISLRTAEDNYISKIKPMLRSKAVSRSNAILSLLDVVVVARQI
jgi:hypothetical protein